jgi:hypothetical protein
MSDHPFPYKIVVDPSVPDGEIWMMDGDEVVGKIVGIDTGQVRRAVNADPDMEWLSLILRMPDDTTVRDIRENFRAIMREMWGREWADRLIAAASRKDPT